MRKWNRKGNRAGKSGPKIILMGIHQTKKGFILVQIDWETLILRPALQSNQGSQSNLHRSRYSGRGGLNGQISELMSAMDDVVTLEILIELTSVMELIV